MNPNTPSAPVPTKSSVAGSGISGGAPCSEICIRVPEDLSIISFDEARAFHSPPVSIVAADHEAMGRRALEALLDEYLWAHPRNVLLPVKLVDRGTTAPPPAE